MISAKWCGRRMQMAALVGMLILISSLSAQPMTTEVLNASPLPRGASWAYAVDRQGGLWMAYYNGEGELRLRDSSGQDRSVGLLAKIQPKTGISMAGGQEEALILWREKFPEKRLFLARGGNFQMEPLELAAGSEPLPRMETVVIKDDIHLLWYGERGYQDPPESDYIYYQRISMDFSRISEMYRVLPGIYPVWANDDNGNLMIVSSRKTGEERIILARTKSAEGNDFGPEITLAKSPAEPESIRAFHSKGRWFVIWQITMNDEVKTVGTYSNDFGATWNDFNIAELDNFAAGSINVTVGNGEHLFIAIGGKDLSKYPEKQDLRLATSADNGATWTVSRLRPEGMAKHFRSFDPVVAVGPKSGDVVVIWEDWRNLRGQLFLNYSEDYGKSWKIYNIPISETDGLNRSLTSRFKPLYVIDGRYHLLVQEFLDDKLSQSNIKQLIFDVQDLERIDSKANQKAVQQSAINPDNAGMLGNRGQAGTYNNQVALAEGMDPEPQGAKAALQKRVETYWLAMKDNNYDATYDMQDPFFRAKNSKEGYTQPMGRIIYRDPSIEVVSMEGPLATVRVQVTVGVKPFRAKTGEMISRPDQTIKFDETWLWIDGNWYKEYYNEYQDKRYTLY